MSARRLLARHRFRVAAALGALAVCLSGTHAAAEGGDEFPYIAYVVEPETVVRSGPGREHYVTAQASAGHAVEVYRHDGAGWCAIRPPEGSFSLVPIQQLRVIDQRTAVIEGDGVPARVGSSLAEKHNAVQVMLDRGEAVALIEPPSPTSPLVRIAPPAGEFRWVAASRLSRVPPTESASASATSGGWQSPPSPAGAPVVAATRIAMPEPRDGEPPVGDPFAHLRRAAAESPAGGVALAAGVGNPAWLPDPAVATLRTSVAGPTGDDLQIVAGSPAAIRQAQFTEPAATASGAAPPLIAGSPAATRLGPPRIRFEGLSAGGAPLDPRVAEMQLRLSQIVVGPPMAWQFASLREETAALLAQEQSPACRDQLRDLLDRIATFETVQGRYRNMPPATQLAAAAGAPGGATATPSPNGGGALGTSDNAELLARVRSDLGGADNGVTPTPGGPAPPPTAQAATEALYDAVGTLKPVVSRRQNAPQFALIDDHGDVVTFVTASPDVNLQAYVGQRIGVRGTRGFMPEYRRAHVTASRVTALEERLVK